jgi:hypothetical protein
VSPWLRFFRLRLAPTALSNVIAGAALGGWRLDTTEWLILLGWTLALYMVGMAFNDVVDRDKDALNAPHRPLPAGEISVAKAHISLILLAVPVVLLLIGMPTDARLYAVAAIVCVLLYNLAFKEVPVLGAAVMGTVRFCIVMVGASFAGPAMNALPLALDVLFFTTAVTYYSQEEERGRPGVLRLRFLLTCIVAFASYTIIDAPSPMPLAMTFLLLCWLFGVASPRPGKPASHTTFSMLLALPLLDLRATIAYPQSMVPVLVVLAWLSLRPWTIFRSGAAAMTPPRRSG